jgi:ABC-type branched-subunit amino acid transport system ATPase component
MADEAHRPLLRLDDVHSGYGTQEIVRGISLQLVAAELVAMIGPNGAGKSTLLRTIFGFLHPTRGGIWLNGEEIDRLRPPEVLRRGIAYVMQGHNILPNLTVEDNLRLGAYIRTDSQVGKDMQHVMERFPILQVRRHQQAKVLSGGEQRILELARVLLTHPKVVLLDEPTLGLAPKTIDQIYAVIHEIREVGTAIFIVEQNARTALQHAQRAFVLEQGRIRFEGRGQEMLDHPEVKTAYLGGR